MNFKIERFVLVLMKRFALALILSAASLLAADATGKWSGKVTIETPEGPKLDDAYVVLKQDGSALTGTAGKDEFEQREISNGKMEGDTVSFELPTSNGGPFKVRMKVDGDTLAGDVERERDGEKMKAKIALKRVK